MHPPDKLTLAAVLGIRGTLSLDDCLTDFLCEPADIDEWISDMHGSMKHHSADRAAEAATQGKSVPDAGTKQHGIHPILERAGDCQ